MIGDIGWNGVDSDDVTTTAIELYREGVPVGRILDATGLDRAALFEVLEAEGLRRGRSSVDAEGTS